MRKSQFSIFASLLLVTLMWPVLVSSGYRGTIGNQIKAEKGRDAGRAEKGRKVKTLDNGASPVAGALNRAEPGPGGRAAVNASTQQQRVDNLQAAARGRKIARVHCARCHVIGDFNPMGGISSTPSFILLVREFEDWPRRFETFYARRPHPAFITIQGIGRSRRDLPANAHPITLSLQAVRDVAAYARLLRKPDAKPSVD